MRAKPARSEGRQDADRAISPKARFSGENPAIWRKSGVPPPPKTRCSGENPAISPKIRIFGTLIALILRIYIKSLYYKLFNKKNEKKKKKDKKNVALLKNSVIFVVPL